MEVVKKKMQVSDDILIQMMKDLLDKGERGATNFYELLRVEIKINKTRCLKIYPDAESQWVKFKNNAIDEVRYEQIADAAVIGLKSDLELEAILCQFASGNLSVSEWVKGQVILRDVTPMESIAAISQIFKKRGSYAATKTDLTSLGEKINQPTILTDNQFDKLLKEINDKSENG
jgi:hypothetical protein